MIKVTDIENYNDLLVEWRRDFHMHPEIGFQEFRTSKIVADLLESFGLEVIKDFCETAVIGVLDTNKPGPTVGLRADMDALAMPDNKDVEYKSTIDGVCHACGHDGHTAILLGVAKYLSENREGLSGKVKFIFQPAEEGPIPGGAKLVLESGMVDDVDVMLAAHTHVLYPTGKIMVKYDELFASGDYFDVTLKGKGGHGAYPHQTTDVMSASATIINQFNQIVSRNIDAVKSGVVSVCYIEAGEYEAKNVIPDMLKLGGTIRTLNDEVRNEIIRRMEIIVKSAGEAFELDAKYELKPMFPILKNDNDIVKLFHDVCLETLPKEMVGVLEDVDIGCEDCAYFAQKIPTCYFYFGVKNEEKNCNAPFHNPMYDMDEDSMIPTMSVFINFVLKYMNK